MWTLAITLLFPCGFISATGEDAVPVTSLADGLRPLEERFNADNDKPRFIAILSPT